MRIVTYTWEYIGNISNDTRTYTTLIDIPLIDWWRKEMQGNMKRAKEYEDGKRPGYQRTIALIYSEEIPDDKYEDLEWYSDRKQL